MNRWNLKIYYSSSVRFEIVTKITSGCARRTSVHLYRNSKCGCSYWIQITKCMCNTHNSNNDKTDQENNDTSILKWQKHQHSRIVVSLFGEWGHCNCHHNADAGNKDWFASGTIRVEPERMLLSLVVYCGFWMREKRWSDNLVSNLIRSESCVWTQSLMLFLNGNCCSIQFKCDSHSIHMGI